MSILGHRVLRKSVSAKVPASTLRPASRDIVGRRVRYADTETRDSEGPGVAHEEVEGRVGGGGGGGGGAMATEANEVYPPPHVTCMYPPPHVTMATEANEVYVYAVQGRHSQK